MTANNLQTADGPSPTHGSETARAPEPASTAPSATGQAIPAEGPAAIEATSPAPSEASEPTEASRDRGLDGRWTKNNKAASRDRRPIDVDEVARLENTYVREYAPANEHGRAMCGEKASIDEAIRRAKRGSPEHQRLVQLSIQLAEALEAARPAAADHADVDRMSLDELAAENARLIALAREIPARTPTPQFDSSPIIDVSANAETPTTPAAEPERAPVPQCEHCHRNFEDCAVLHESDIELWRTFHFNDPIEVDRRAKAATEEMYEAIRRQQHGDPWIR